MLRSAATAASPGRLRAVAVLGLVLLLLPGRGSGQQPAPIAPTVPPPGGFTLPLPPAGLPAIAVTAQPNGNEDKGVKPDDAPADGAPVVPELSLGECVAIALDRQPSLRAVRASQQATSASINALNNIGRLGSVVSPDLPIRKDQAARGGLAAAADVQKQHNEVVQDVTRLYYTVVLAGQQAQIAEDVVEQLALLVKIGEDLLNSPNPGDMTKAKLDAMKIGLNRARGLHATARQGQKQAYAALREVLAVTEAEFPFRVRDKELPVMAQKVPLTKDMVVEMALCRRPELTLAAAGADAFRLEVYAQGRVPFRRSVPTLASGADIHARLLPPGNRDLTRDYRPEPIAPEMPPQLVGSKADRVARAMAFSHRADAVFEKTRNLITLEAENTFFVFELAAERVQHGKEGFDAARDLMERVKENINNPKSPKDQLLLGYAEAARSQADYVEAVYQYLITLAALERVTAGGVRPAFPGR